MHVARKVRASHLPEPAVGKGGTDVLELGVVENVEGLRPDFQMVTAGFSEGEALEQRQVPVVAARTVDRTGGEIAPLADRGSEEAGRIEPLG